MDWAGCPGHSVGLSVAAFDMEAIEHRRLLALQGGGLLPGASMTVSVGALPPFLSTG